jgi:hypothetical protein
MAVRDIVLIAIVMFALTLGILVIYTVSGTVINQMVMIPAINQSAGTTAVFESTLHTLNKLDMALFGVFIGMVLALMITSWILPASPVYAFFYMIVGVVAVVISAFLGNVWEAFSQNAFFISATQHFPIMNHIISYLPIYTAVITFIGLVVIFAKPSDSGVLQ